MAEIWAVVPLPGFVMPAAMRKLLWRVGFEAWRNAQQPLLCTERLPERDDAGRTTLVTRARPKILRIVCPWLIRRFIDPHAIFLFVPPSDVAAVVARFRATPFDTGHGV
jgi:hypothetical protein